MEDNYNATQDGNFQQDNVRTDNAQTGNTQTSYSQPNYTQPNYSQPSPAGRSPQSGKSIASLVLGITSVSLDVMCSCIGGFFIAFIPGIIGFILGLIAMREDKTDNMAKAGFILSIIGAALSIIILIIFGILALLSMTDIIFSFEPYSKLI